MLDLVRSVYPDTLAVYVDTGLEYPEVKQFVKTVPNVKILRPKKSFRQVIEDYGYPVISKDVSNKIDALRKNPHGWAEKYLDPNYYKGIFSIAKWQFLIDSDIKISDKCCHIMKKAPLKSFKSSFGLYPIIGTMTCESRQRKTIWLKYGCNSFEGSDPSSKPMSFWTEQDVLRYIVENNLPYAAAYGEILQDNKGKYHTTKCDRTGCMFCMFGCHLEKEPNRFQRLKQTHPKIWEYCMRPWDEGGLGLKRVLDFINVKYE